MSGSRDKSIHIWSINTGETINKINVGSEVLSIRVLLDRNQILCGLSGISADLRIYNYNDGSLVETLVGHSNSVNSLEILNEQYIASGSEFDSVFIWDLNTYKIKYVLRGHNGWVYCIKRISSNLIASGDINGKIIIWDWLQYQIVYTLTGHTSGLFLSSLDLFDEQTFISGSLDQTIKFWNISNRFELIQTINTTFPIGALAVIKQKVA